MKLVKLKTPWRMTLDTNPDDCVLHCIMCEHFSRFNPKKRERRLMPIELVRKALTEAVDIGVQEIIPSTMGEPLLYSGIDEIIRVCHKDSLKLNLTTNGMFPRLGAREWAGEIILVASDVKISFNGVKADTQEKIMQGSKFKLVLQNIKDFIAVRDRVVQEGGNRCQITLQMTFMELNYRELPDMVQLAASLGVDRVKGHHLWVHFPEMEEQSMRRSPDSMQRWNAIVDKAYRYQQEFPMPGGQLVKLDNIWSLNPSIEEIIPDGVCPFLGQEIWIATDGRFNPCCAPDEKRKKLGYFGNVNESSIMEIWESQEYEHLCRNYLEHEVCQTCNMRRPKED